MSRRDHAVVVALSRTADDPRVKRQIRTLLADGWTVTSVGHGAAGDPEAGWRHRAIADVGHDARPVQRGLRIAGLLATRMAPGLARTIWREQPRHRILVEALADIDGAGLVIANDYATVPACVSLAGRLGAGLIYDMHEYAVGEREEDRSWRLLYPPYVAAIEHLAIEAGAVLSTVSDGIADRVAKNYRLPARPAVIRNLPSFVATSPRPVGAAHLVHHHGAIVPGRGLESLVRSVALWEPRFRLRIRGPDAGGYRKRLEDLARDEGVAGRIAFEGPIAADDLIPMAADADIGIHVLPGFSTQNRYALPNKLFEYVMAGLAVVVTDLPEMARLVTHHDLGRLLPNISPAAIASAVNGFDRTAIERCKRNALLAAPQLSWDAEGRRFLDLCRSARR